MKNFAELKKTIRSRKWVTASTPGHLMTCYPWVKGHIEMQRFFPVSTKDMWVYFKDTLGFQAADERQIFRNLQHLYVNQRQARAVYKQWRNDSAVFFRKAEKNVQRLNKLSDAAFVALYCTYLRDFALLWAPALAVDLMGVYTESMLLPELRAHLPEKEKPNAEEIFAELSQPASLSFVAEERISLLSLALLYQKSRPAFPQALARHQRNFYWTTNTYKYIRVLSEDYFKARAIQEAKRPEKELRDEIGVLRDLPRRAKKRKTEILKTLRLPKDFIKRLLFTAVLGIWLDERKKANLRGNHFLSLFVKELARRFGYTEEEAYYLLPEECGKLLDGWRIAKKELRSRIHRSLFIASRSRSDMFFSGKRAIELIARLEERVHSLGTKEIRGIVASRGREKLYRGRIRIVHDVFKDIFEEGEILVTSATRPEFVPLMRKALCIITDEGGIASHAAVISRELGIPCIIGTKIATQVLKDGMTVEVDANKGTVKVLKRAGK